MINANLLGTTKRESRQYCPWIFSWQIFSFSKTDTTRVRFLAFGGVWRLRSLLRLDHRHYHYRYRRHHRLFAIKKVLITITQTGRGNL